MLADMASKPSGAEDEEPNLRELITLKQAAEQVDLSYSHLRLLAREGRIWAVRVGHEWLTTLQAVQTYIEDGHRPGPKAHKDSPESPEGD